MSISRIIDHTLLKPDATLADIDRLCREARQLHFFAVCVNPVHVRKAVGLLRESDVKVCTVVGFPLGASVTETKVFETRVALRHGAQEIDMVLNIGALKSGDFVTALHDIKAVAEACHPAGVILKVILETALLTHDEKFRACQLCIQANANFVKTSTGFGPSGATAQDVALMSQVVKSHGLGVKASGGIRNFANLTTMVRAGATRIGTSHGIAIMQEAAALQP
jgi:deoxyribose-phosphate aldolase